MSRLGTASAITAANTAALNGGSAAAARTMYLQYLRLNFPTLYAAAIAKAVQTIPAADRVLKAASQPMGDYLSIAPTGYGANGRSASRGRYFPGQVGEIPGVWRNKLQYNNGEGLGALPDRVLPDNIHPGRSVGWDVNKMAPALMAGVNIGDLMTAWDRVGRRFYDGQGLGATFKTYTPATGQAPPDTFPIPRGMMAGTRRDVNAVIAGRPFSERAAAMDGLSDYTSYAIPAYTSAQIAASAAPASVDLSSITPTNINIPASQTSTGTSTTADTTPSTNWASVFGTVLSTVTTAVKTVANLTNPASASILAINTQRAAQGLPPLNNDGTVMTPAELAAAGYTSAQISAMEAKIASSSLLSGATLLGIPIIAWLAGGVLFAVVANNKR